MPMSIDDRKNAIQKTIGVLTSCQARLGELRKGASPTDLAGILADKSDVDAELIRQQDMHAHLIAADVQVQPMSDQDAQELATLGQKLDDAIMHGAILNADLSFVEDVLSSAQKIGDIVKP